MRRSRHISFVLAALLLGAASTVTAQSSRTRVEVREVGLRLDLPRGWHWQPSQVVLENRALIELADRDFEELLRNRAQLPRAVVTRHRLDHPAINPTVQVAVRELSGRMPTPEQGLQVALELMRRQFADVTVVDPVTTTTVAGLPAATMRVRYALRTAGRSFEVESRMLLVVANRHSFSVGVSGPARGRDRSTREFNAVMASVRALD